jgi:asparagine synthase (glutamine-hydrolysing)
VDSRGQVQKVKYWDPAEYFDPAPQRALSDEEAAEELESILRESFALRMVSDVPVGIFLSGGIDSTLVTALLQKESTARIKTFTIGFHELSYNEAPHARTIAEYLGTDHTELYCTPDDAARIIPKLPEIYDEPFGDSSAIPTYLVSQLARSKVKVSLSADGGDEQFFGYDRYWLGEKYINAINRIPFQPCVAKALGALPVSWGAALCALAARTIRKKIDPQFAFLKIKRMFSMQGKMAQYNLAIRTFLDEELRALGVPEAPGDALVSEDRAIDFSRQLMRFELKTYLPGDILVKIDRAAMAVALEGREPLLDNRIIEFSSRLPMHCKYREKTSKYIIRKILYKYVPQHLVDRPKQGFGVPVDLWFKDSLKKYYLEYFDEQRIRRGGLFDPALISGLLRGYVQGNKVNAEKMWLLFMFELWKERWM